MMSKKNLKRQLRKAKKMTQQRSSVGNPEDLESLKRWRERHFVSTSINDGDHLEEIVQKICERIGVPDLVFRTPKFMDGPNQKEVADILVLLGTTLIAFQIKHKTLSPEKDEATILGRAGGLVDKAIGQFETIIRLLKNRLLPPLTNLRGNQIDIASTPNLNLVCISVVAFPGVENFPEEKKFELQNGFRLFRDYPVHIFDINDFDKVSIELDTLPDLLSYLDRRRDMLEGQMIGDLNELDFLAFYKTKLPEIEEEFAGPIDGIALEPGIWDYYVSHLAPAIIRRNELNLTSYIVDKILQGSHRSIGYEINHDPELLAVAPPGSVEAHFQLSTDLASLKRLARRAIGEAVRDCALRADVNLKTRRFPIAFRVIKHLDDSEIAVVILTVVDAEVSRQQRAALLRNACFAAYRRLELKAVIGIAIESASSLQRSEDFFVARDVVFDEASAKAIDEFANRTFGPLKGLKSSEYGGDDITPKT
ncbi:hypothetical protein [Oligoflexus tunisiensis]|uniref:hypothetical protein n=1 Tax=Oligoflexus tunisiensis TaxID=708132 RepID=UPI00114D3924|nr:hypothetical protein [Oligoflexus tunisiensis]